MQQIVSNSNNIPEKSEGSKSVWDMEKFPSVTKPTNITPKQLLQFLQDYSEMKYKDIRDCCAEYHINTHTFYGLCRSYPEIERAYLSAQMERAEILSHEALTIADDDSGDLIMQESKNGNTFFTANMANVKRSDLRCRQRNYLMERYNPEKYASRTKVEQTSKSLNIHAHVMMPDVSELENIGLDGLQDIQRNMRYGESAAQYSGATRR